MYHPQQSQVPQQFRSIKTTAHLTTDDWVAVVRVLFSVHRSPVFDSVDVEILQIRQRPQSFHHVLVLIRIDKPDQGVDSKLSKTGASQRSKQTSIVLGQRIPTTGSDPVFKRMVRVIHFCSQSRACKGNKAFERAKNPIDYPNVGCWCQSIPSVSTFLTDATIPKVCVPR